MNLNERLSYSLTLNLSIFKILFVLYSICFVFICFIIKFDLFIIQYIYPGLVVGTVCPVFALMGVATVDLGAEILATAAAPRGT